MVDSIRQIRAFLAVARCGGFTRASTELHVSQPALTVQVQQLEEALGIRLFNRIKRKVSLTQAGQELIGPLEQIMLDVGSVMNMSRDLVELRSGEVRVAAVPSLTAMLFPQVLRDFIQLYPGVSVQLRDSIGDLEELVKGGFVDFGVGAAVRRHRSIAMEDLFTEPICVFAPSGHPLAGKEVVELRELVDYPIILPTRNSSLRHTLEGIFENQRLSIRTLSETGHISSTIGLVKAGLGIAILPFRAIDSFFSTDVRVIKIIKPALERRVVILTKLGRSSSPAALKLIDIIRRIAPQLPTFENRLAPIMPRAENNGGSVGCSELDEPETRTRASLRNRKEPQPRVKAVRNRSS